MPGHDFERSPHGFCHGWQNGSPGTLKSCYRVGMGSVPVFSRSGAGETQLFHTGIMDSTTSGFRPFICFDPLVFIFFSGGGGSCRRQGKSAAPSGRRGERVGRYSRVSPVSLKHSEKRDRRGRGLDQPAGPSPRPPGPPRSRGMAKMGGPGAAGLWRGLRRLPSVLALGPARGRQVRWS